MKKILVLVLTLAMVLTLCILVSCGESDPSVTTNNKQDTTTTPTPAVTTPAGETSSEATTGTPITTTTPKVIESSPKVTTTTPATVPPTPGNTPLTRDPAKEYHVEDAIYKTSSKGEDEEFIVINNAGANMNERYADGEGMVLYEINISEMIEPTITLKVRQMYLVYWTNSLDVIDYADMQCAGNFLDTESALREENPDAFTENGEYVGGTNITDLVINPSDLEYTGVIYIYLINAKPEFGHGGTIMSLTISQYKEGKAEEKPGIDNTPGEPHYKPAGSEQIIDEYLVNGNDEDEAFIHLNTASATDKRRYADGTSFLIYRIDLRNMYEPTVELYITQNYKIEISPDGETWYEIANFATSAEYAEKYAADSSKFHASGDYLEGDNWSTLVIDPYEPGENIDALYGNLYIRISDCFPSAGWGGAIEKLTIKHYGFVNAE